MDIEIGASEENVESLMTRPTRPAAQRSGRFAELRIH